MMHGEDSLRITAPFPHPRTHSVIPGRYVIPAKAGSSSEPGIQGPQDAAFAQVCPQRGVPGEGERGVGLTSPKQSPLLLPFVNFCITSTLNHSGALQSSEPGIQGPQDAEFAPGFRVRPPAAPE